MSAVFFSIVLLSQATMYAESIDETTFVQLGGLQQWVSIQGEDRTNLVLLVVHGGPGETQWPRLEKYKSWEKAFTVVQWDQRGTGHTFGRYGKETPNVTLDQIAKDGVELSRYLRQRLGKKKIIVLGHSWGSYVAIAMVQRESDLFAAYVGTGQASSWKATVNFQFDLLLDKARRDGEVAKLKELQAIGRPDPTTAKGSFGFKNGFINAMAPADQQWINSMRSEFPELKARDPKEAQNIDDGMEFSGDKLLPDEMATDLPATATDIKTAFFIIQGKDDVIAPTSLAVDYFNRVKAPVKDLVLIPDAGHFAFMTAADSFLSALIEKVRPVAIQRGG